MKKTGEYGKFFPGSFAANTYDESLAGFYWPLTKENSQKYGFRLSDHKQDRPAGSLDLAEIPDNSAEADESLPTKVFWDDQYGRPFQIHKADIAFAASLKVPLPYSYYARRLKENFRMIHFNGSLRSINCPQCQKDTQTSWYPEYDGRILCEKCYFQEVY